MSRLRIQVLAALLAGLIAGARPLDAQQSSEPRTYTVKRGDTLWSIAKELLGDSLLWPEIYRLNVGAIADPHWIYPGTTLKLPANGAGEGQMAAAKPGAEPGTETYVSSGLRRPNERPTVFDPNARKVESRTRESLILGARATAVRPGDFLAAPFVVAAPGLGDGGKLEWTTESQGIDLTVAQRPIQLSEEVLVLLPKGASATPNSRLLVYRKGPALEGQGQVLVPTGILRVIGAAEPGRARAALQLKFEDVFIGQHVTVLDTLVSRPNVFPSRVEFGTISRIQWVQGDPVIPAPGHFLVLSATAKDGLAPGDQVTLLRDGGTDANGNVVGDEDVGMAQITRVTPYGASAVLLRQTGPTIGVGTRVRVTAKMP